MSQLLHVPIIHSSVDLGSAAAALTLRSTALAGEGRWVVHQETRRKFWEVVAAYLRQFDPRSLKVYQGGLTARRSEIMAGSTLNIIENFPHSQWMPGQRTRPVRTLPRRSRSCKPSV